VTQSRLGSLIEALFNIVIGYTINFVFNFLILNGVFDLHVTVTQNLLIGVLFTVVSLTRQYVIRRWFNGRMHATSERWAARIAGD
jgi:hypothetical protein